MVGKEQPDLQRTLHEQGDAPPHGADFAERLEAALDHEDELRRLQPTERRVAGHQTPSPTWRRRVWQVAAVAAVAVAACLAIVLLGRQGAPPFSKLPAAAAAEIVTVSRIDAGSSVADILEFTQTAPKLWERIYALGREGPMADGSLQPFTVAADRVSGNYLYLSEFTSSGQDANGDYYRNGVRVRILPLRVRPSPTNNQATRAPTNAAEAVDPYRMRSDESRVVNTPINDYINPSYWLRSQVMLQAESVEKLGMMTIGGRQAVHLRVVFPASIRKEDHWDLYIDTQTGIVLGFVLTPLTGNPRFETWIDDVKFNGDVPDSAFARPDWAKQ
jgi:hypothetical protein